MPAEAVIYQWVDERGHVNFDDDLERVPEAQRPAMKVFQAKARPAAAEPEPGGGPRQAAFARQLARDLGLQKTDTQDPVSVLQVVGVYPAIGWHPAAPLTPAIVDEVVRAAVAAARGRRLSQSPSTAEAAVLGVAKNLGMDVPPPTVAPEPSPPPPEPVPIIFAPQIVLESPPPAVPIVVQQPAYYPGHFEGFVPIVADASPRPSRGRPLTPRIPPLTRPVTGLRPPVIQPLQIRSIAPLGR
jgi:hypothetical protein